MISPGEEKEEEEMASMKKTIGAKRLGIIKAKRGGGMMEWCRRRKRE